MTAHTCHAIGCPVEVPPRMLMCRRHWRMVPPELQARVWATYRKGQEVDKRPSAAYLRAGADAIAAVLAAELEARAERPPEQGELFELPPSRIHRVIAGDPGDDPVDTEPDGP